MNATERMNQQRIQTMRTRLDAVRPILGCLTQAYRLANKADSDDSAPALRPGHAMSTANLIRNALRQAIQLQFECSHKQVSNIMDAYFDSELTEEALSEIVRDIITPSLIRD